MAERVKYNTTGTEEEKIPELEELAAAPAPAAGAAPAPSYNPSTREKQSALFEQIASRGPFQYDPANDPLYKATKDRYVQSGRMAMKDTMGQAAALTGGYGSSYGQAVGQQAYDRNLQGLADMIPELYQTAYKKYQDEGDRLQKQYDLLGQQEEREYSRYRDELGDWQYERAWQQQQQDAERQRTDEAYNRLYMLIGATGYMPTEDELAASGMSKEQAEALRREYLRQTGQLEPEPGSGGGGGSGSGGAWYGGGNNGNGSGNGSSGSTVADYMKYLLNAGMSEDEAWDFLADFDVPRIAKPGKTAKQTPTKPTTNPVPKPTGPIRRTGK